MAVHLGTRGSDVPRSARSVAGWTNGGHARAAVVTDSVTERDYRDHARRGDRLLHAYLLHALHEHGFL